MPRISSYRTGSTISTKTEKINATLFYFQNITGFFSSFFAAEMQQISTEKHGASPYVGYKSMPTRYELYHLISAS